MSGVLLGSRRARLAHHLPQVFHPQTLALAASCLASYVSRVLV